MPYLIGEHVMLREYRQDDFTSIRKWVNDRATTRYLSPIFWFPQTEAGTNEFLTRVMHGSDNGAFFVIADVKNQSYIGQLDIFEINWKLRQGTVGMVIGSDEHRGKGYGTEALKLLEDYTFNMLGLERLQLDVCADNARAIRCYMKVGFVHEGIRRHATMVDGRFTDLHMMAVLKQDYDKQ
jgi:RimJ/RimL family protein N-acetyltransferase